MKIVNLLVLSLLVSASVSQTINLTTEEKVQNVVNTNQNDQNKDKNDQNNSGEVIVKNDNSTNQDINGSNTGQNSQTKNDKGQEKVDQKTTDSNTSTDKKTQENENKPKDDNSQTKTDPPTKKVQNNQIIIVQQKPDQKTNTDNKNPDKVQNIIVQVQDKKQQTTNLKVQNQEDHCQTWNEDQTQCTKCLDGYSLDVNSLCTQSIKNCKSYDWKGRCYECVQDTQCQLANLLNIDVNNFDSINPDNYLKIGCREWDQKQGKCVDCLLGWYFISSTSCNIIRLDSCEKYDQITGECLNKAKILPPNCIQIDPTNDSKCKKCFFLYKLDNDNSKCIKDDSLPCVNYNPANGQCIGPECKPGYIFDAKINNCITKQQLQKSINSLNSGSNKSSLCITKHPSLGTCIQCNQGYHPDPVNPTQCTSEQY